MRRASTTGPVKVVLVDLSSPVRAIEAARADGVRYLAARIVAFRDGRPVGELTAPLTNGGLTPEQVTSLLAQMPATREDDEPYEPPVWPRVSVVVATNLARPEALTRCLAALSGQDYPDFEVIVVDNRPERSDSGGIRPEWTEDARVRFVAEPHPGASAARNRGLAEASGEIVAFTDDDTSADRRWLRALVTRFLVEPDADCVTGMVLPGELETPAQQWFDSSGSAFRPYYRRASFAGPASGFTVVDRLAPGPTRPRPVYRFARYGTGCNMAVRARVLRDLGGFDPALGPGTPAGAGEDLLVFLRLLTSGGRLAYEPAAVVRHWHRRDLAALRHQLRSYGTGFTAMLVAAIRADPRHVFGLTRMLARLGWRDGRPGASSGVALPARLFWDRRWGDLRGPIAYLAGRRRIRKWPS